MMCNPKGLARTVVAVCIFFGAGLAACGPGASASLQPTPAVTVDILPPGAQALPLPECAETAGVSLNVQPPAGGEVRLTASGLNPGEKVSLLFYAEADGRTFAIESSLTASAQGQVEYVENLGLVANGFFKVWQVRVVHARGVACAQVSLP